MSKYGFLASFSSIFVAWYLLPGLTQTPSVGAEEVHLNIPLSIQMLNQDVKHQNDLLFDLTILVITVSLATCRLCKMRFS